MDSDCNVRILDISHYLGCPPVSGGSLRILSPLIKMSEDSRIKVDIVFSTFSEEYSDKCKEYLEKYPSIGYVEGVVTRYHERMGEGCPTDFSVDVWKTMSAELKDRVIDLVKEKKYDIIQIEHSQMSWIVPFLRVASPNSYFVLDCHNIEYMIYEKWLPHADSAIKREIESKYKNLYEWEHRVWGWYDAAFTVSSIEEKILNENGVKETYLVPTGGGIDPDKYEPICDNRDRPYDILYMGTMEWFPNAHGLIWFIENVFPKILEKRPDTVLHIVGSGKPAGNLYKVAKSHKNIVFWGQQDDDVRFFHSSKVFVVPLWIGAGARVKVLTAWASKIPIVSTFFGAEGNETHNNENIIMTDDPDEYADSVLRLLNDPNECKRIYDNAFELFSKKYSVQCCVDVLVKSYYEMANNLKNRK